MSSLVVQALLDLERAAVGFSFSQECGNEKMKVAYGNIKLTV